MCSCKRSLLMPFDGQNGNLYENQQKWNASKIPDTGSQPSVCRSSVLVAVVVWPVGTGKCSTVLKRAQNIRAPASTHGRPVLPVSFLPPQIKASVNRSPIHLANVCCLHAGNLQKLRLFCRTTQNPVQTPQSPSQPRPRKLNPSDTTTSHHFTQSYS